VARAAHLTKRFVGSLRPARLSSDDAVWAAEQLLPAERELWAQMSPADRRHALGVARDVERRLGVEATRAVLAAALLHDVGKIDAGLGTYGRVMATRPPPLPHAYLDLVEAPNTAVLTTLLADGSPQASPVWFWFDGEEIQVSTTAQRLKHRNVQRDPRVSLTIIDPTKPLRYLEIRGTVTVTADPDGIVRDLVAVKHGYADGTAFDPPGSKRVTFHLTPTRVIEH